MFLKTWSRHDFSEYRKKQNETPASNKIVLPSPEEKEPLVKLKQKNAADHEKYHCD